MKKALIPVLLFLISSAALAQEIDTESWDPLITTGWFATVGGGIGTYDNGPFSRRLQSYTPSINGRELLYRTESFAYTGPSFNASLGFIFSRSYLVGLNGEKVFFPEIVSRNGSTAKQDRYALGAYGGGIDLGYALVNGAGTIVYPFLHGGYYGYTLDYTNNQSDSIPFFEGKPVAAGSTATYGAAAMRLGFGVGLTRYIGGKRYNSNSGFVVNARLYYGRMLSRPEWEQNGAIVNNGGHTPEYNGISLSVCIGYGSVLEWFEYLM